MAGTLDARAQITELSKTHLEPRESSANEPAPRSKPAHFDIRRCRLRNIAVPETPDESKNLTQLSP